MGARETLEMLSAQMEIERLRTQLARATKQRDEAWGMVEGAYREAWINAMEDFGPYGEEIGPNGEDEGGCLAAYPTWWNCSESKRALDAARAESDNQ